MHSLVVKNRKCVSVNTFSNLSIKYVPGQTTLTFNIRFSENKIRFKIKYFLRDVVIYQGVYGISTSFTLDYWIQGLVNQVRKYLEHPLVPYANPLYPASDNCTNIDAVKYFKSKVITHFQISFLFLCLVSSEPISIHGVQVLYGQYSTGFFLWLNLFPTVWFLS